MKLLFTICARAGSKGVKNKNIRNFLNHPLVYYTLSAFKIFKERYERNFEMIHLAVNTDSDELINQVNQFNIDYIFVKRKEHLSGDTVSKPDVIKDTVGQAEQNIQSTYDIIIDLDLTSPIRTVDDVYNIINALQDDSNTDVVFSMANARRSPYFNQVNRKESGYYSTVFQSKFVSRQEAPVCYDMNASIYAYKRKFIMNETTRRVFDGNAIGVVVKDTAVLDIDNEEDLELMEVIAEYFFRNYGEYKEIYQYIN